MSHEIARQTKKWGTFGKNGDEPLRWILIKDITDDHLNNILIHMNENFDRYRNDVIDLIIDEAFYRKANDITVKNDLGNFKFLTIKINKYEPYLAF